VACGVLLTQRIQDLSEMQADNGLEGLFKIVLKEKLQKFGHLVLDWVVQQATLEYFRRNPGDKDPIGTLKFDRLVLKNNHLNNRLVSFCNALDPKVPKADFETWATTHGESIFSATDCFVPCECIFMLTISAGEMTFPYQPPRHPNLGSLLHSHNAFSTATIEDLRKEVGMLRDANAAAHCLQICPWPCRILENFEMFVQKLHPDDLEKYTGQRATDGVAVVPL
jgi:hypothetical protein